MAPIPTQRQAVVEMTPIGAATARWFLPGAPCLGSGKRSRESTPSAGTPAPTKANAPWWAAPTPPILAVPPALRSAWAQEAAGLQIAWPGRPTC
eukprot:898865-Pyramimonas_sp.AAC.1